MRQAPPRVNNLFSCPLSNVVKRLVLQRFATRREASTGRDSTGSMCVRRELATGRRRPDARDVTCWTGAQRCASSRIACRVVGSARVAHRGTAHARGIGTRAHTRSRGVGTRARARTRPPPTIVLTCVDTNIYPTPPSPPPFSQRDATLLTLFNCHGIPIPSQ
jgi:hypothetical protein